MKMNRYSTTTLNTFRRKHYRNPEPSWTSHLIENVIAYRRPPIVLLWLKMDWNLLETKRKIAIVRLMSVNEAYWIGEGDLPLNGCWNECLRNMALTRMSEARCGMERTEWAKSSAVISRGPLLQFSSSAGSGQKPSHVTHECTLISGTVMRWLGSLHSIRINKSFNLAEVDGLAGNRNPWCWIKP